MSCDDDAAGWRYAPYRSLLGALERGLGVAVAELRSRPQRAELVFACTSRDTRWDWQVDERYVYLARLLRDLRLDPAPLVAQLRACGPYRRWPHRDPADDDNRFDLAVGVLEVLARSGDERARRALRDYVGDGVRWLDALKAMVGDWPVDWWDDLWKTATVRVGSADPMEVWPSQQPWRRWRGRDPGLDAVLDAITRARPDPGAGLPDLSAVSEADLLALLRDASADAPTRSAALRQIRRLGRPVPQLLDLAERPDAVRSAAWSGALRILGPLVVPSARRWAEDPDHPLHRDGPGLLAEYGDEPDIPLLLAALDRLPDRWCGCHHLAEGLARILADLPPTAHAETRAALTGRLHWLTFASPHSYERASYLRSLLLLDAERTTERLPIHLLDCEADVRLLAARRTPLTEEARRWLVELRDDPIEEAEIRNAAAERLGGGLPAGGAGG